MVCGTLFDLQGCPVAVVYKELGWPLFLVPGRYLLSLEFPKWQEYLCYAWWWLMVYANEVTYRELMPDSLCWWDEAEWGQTTTGRPITWLEPFGADISMISGAGRGGRRAGDWLHPLAHWVNESCLHNETPIKTLNTDRGWAPLVVETARVAQLRTGKASCLPPSRFLSCSSSMG